MTLGSNKMLLPVEHQRPVVTNNTQTWNVTLVLKQAANTENKTENSYLGAHLTSEVKQVLDDPITLEIPFPTPNSLHSKPNSLDKIVPT